MATAPVTTYRFSVDDYYKMAEAGILHEDDRVELIEGEVITMTPIGSRHAACVSRINKLFSRALSDAVILRVQDPIRLDDFNEPEPDLALVAFRADFYAEQHPRPEDVLLAIEVADSSLAYDRETKIPLYARSGIREVWLVDLQYGEITVYRQPTLEGYGLEQRYQPSDTLEHPTRNTSLRVQDILLR